MYTSKFKLILHWLLITIGFYLFWGCAYLILTKFALDEFNRFTYKTSGFWSKLTASDVFWYALFIFGIAIVIFVFRKFLQYSPSPKIAALIFSALIIVSVGILLDKLLETTKLFNNLPHIVINLVFITAILMRGFRKEKIADVAQ